MLLMRGPSAPYEETGARARRARRARQGSRPELASAAGRCGCPHRRSASAIATATICRSFTCIARRRSPVSPAAAARTGGCRCSRTAPAHEGELRPAAAMPMAVLQAVDAAIDGEPLDAAAERAGARRRLALNGLRARRPAIMPAESSRIADEMQFSGCFALVACGALAFGLHAVGAAGNPEARQPPPRSRPRCRLPPSAASDGRCRRRESTRRRCRTRDPGRGRRAPPMRPSRSRRCWGWSSRRAPASAAADSCSITMRRRRRSRPSTGAKQRRRARPPACSSMTRASRSRIGDAVLSGRSTGVPGAIAMLGAVHARHGALPWAKLFEPAIRAAEGGLRRAEAHGAIPEQ